MALERFLQMREREGARMREDVLNRRRTILEAVAVVEERSPQTVKEHMDKVEARMRELLDTATVDEQRLLTEAALFADKIAVAEETVRLRSHLDQLEHMLDSGEPVGRKLDFLVQEINREANTIGSKSQDVQLARVVVDIKAEIEKIREQIQNIEYDFVYKPRMKSEWNRKDGSRMKLINIGFGNMVSASRLVAIVSPESAPIKRIIQDAKDRGTLIDATYGRRTRAVLVTDSDHVILSAVQPETVANRLNDREDEEDLEEDE